MIDNILTMIAPVSSSQRSASLEQKTAPVDRGQAELKAQPVAEIPLAEAVERINDFIQIARSDLVFSVDESTGRTVVSVVDAQTQEVIRQIPSEEVLAIAARLDEARGLLFEGKV